MFSRKRVTNVHRLHLLLWKNWLLMVRTRTKIFAQIGLPLIIVIIFVIVRRTIPTVLIDQHSYQPIPLIRNLQKSPETHLCYVGQNETFRKLMEKVNQVLQLKTPAKELFNESDMEEYLKDSGEPRLAGIVFAMDGTELIMKIRMGSVTEESNKTIQIGHRWYTDKMYADMFDIHTRYPQYQTGGLTPGYVETGFVAIQSALALAYLSQYGLETRFNQIQLQRFSQPPYYSDSLQVHNRWYLIVNVVLGYLYICLYNVKMIVMEKELQFKDAMTMMGLPNGLHFVAWMIEILIIFMLTITMTLLLWKFGPLFPHFDIVLMWLFFLTYGVALCGFVFLLSSLFDDSGEATVYVIILWIFTVLPYIQCLTSTSRLLKYVCCLSINSAVLFGMDIFLNRYTLQDGVQFHNYAQYEWFEKSLSIADVHYMLIVDAFIYVLAALYIDRVRPGKYGVPANWYFPLELFSSRNLPPVSAKFEPGNEFEKGPAGQQASIRIIGLTKIYSNATVALKELSMNIYENEITVLLGENGAGKSTLMSILTGLYPPTAGTAIINGFDIRSHIDVVHESLGICPQHNILFDLLTVNEHILFFSQLKGLTHVEAEYESNKYILQLELENKKHAPAKTLSGGMKRKLSLAIALCGDSKVVLCDEPTAGMDPGARRAVWDLLQTEKLNRTIILSTHFMDEADILSDRVAIIESGKLKCFGTATFLTALYGGSVYKLIFEKSENCDIPGVTAAIRKYVPGATINTNVGSELSYKLDDRYQAAFQGMLSEIELNSNKLGLYGYGISLTGLEEVFFKVLSENDTFSETIDLELTQTVEDVHYITARNQVCAIFWKKFYYSKSKWVSFMTQILLPPTIVYLLSFATDVNLLYLNEPALNITLDVYKNDPIAVLSDSSIIFLDGVEYARPFDEPEIPRKLILERDVDDYILNYIKFKDIPTFRMRYLVGASFTQKQVIAWFNNHPYHAIPLSLSLVFNAVLKVNCSSCSMLFVNHPIPRPVFVQLDSKMMDHVMLMLAMDIAMGTMVAFYIVHCIAERQSRCKLMQFVSGLNPMIYWFFNLVFDFCITIITIIIILALWMVFRDAEDSHELPLLLIMLAYTLAGLAFVYLRSLRYSNGTSGFMNTIILSNVLGRYLQLFVEHAGRMVIKDHGTIMVISGVLRIIPFYNVAQATENILLGEHRHWDWYATDGILQNLAMFLATLVILFSILVANDGHYLWRLLYVFRTKSVGSVKVEALDVDVAKERTYVASMGPTNIEVLNLVVREMSKKYGKQVVVNELSLSVENAQCFGLLGTNGAGKTSVFKMLTGDEDVSSGEAWVRGRSLKREIRKMYKEIGYCPQFDALLGELTCRETLKVFCLLRGYSLDNVDQATLHIAHALGFLKHIDKAVQELSGGNRRKLSLAIALLNNPAVLYMDEPSTGLDPGAKRQMWKLINNHRDKGNSIVISSHSMEECEALCTRLAIMVNGELKCIGSPQHLKNRFAEGFLLIMHQNRAVSNLMQPSSETEIYKLNEMVLKMFPGCMLRENYQGRLTYYIPLAKGLRWSVMFGIMESMKSKLNIESYSISQLGLEQVFLSFTKFQIEDKRQSD